MVVRDEPDLAPALRMRRLLYGQLLSRALCAVAAARVPDLLAEGPRSAPELADRIVADPDALRQVLRALAAFDVFVEHPDGTFALTPLGATLCADAPASALPTALLVGGEIGRAWNEFDLTLRAGPPAFDAVFGVDFFTYANLKPELRLVFDQSQARGLELDLPHISQAVPVAGSGTIVDLGGGDGALLAHLLAAHPTVNAVLMDLPHVVSLARDRLAEQGLADRCEFVAGDFFQQVPGGGDLYLLRQILHDWDDPHCLELLAACRRAMPEPARLMIIELLVDHRIQAAAGAELTALMDLYMLSIFHGRERTRAEFADLLERTGFAITEVATRPDRMAAITAVPVG